jgi:hypothetical protein
MAGRQTVAGVRQVDKQEGRQKQQESDRSAGRRAVTAVGWFGANGRPAAYLMSCFDKRPKKFGDKLP